MDPYHGGRSWLNGTWYHCGSKMDPSTVVQDGSYLLIFFHGHFPWSSRTQGSISPFTLGPSIWVFPLAPHESPRPAPKTPAGPAGSPRLCALMSSTTGDAEICGVWLPSEDLLTPRSGPWFFLGQDRCSERSILDWVFFIVFILKNFAVVDFFWWFHEVVTPFWGNTHAKTRLVWRPQTMNMSINLGIPRNFRVSVTKESRVRYGALGKKLSCPKHTPWLIRWFRDYHIYITYIYPLVMTNIAIENHRIEWIFRLNIVIFHSYVCLPEGIWINFSVQSSCHPTLQVYEKIHPQLRRFCVGGESSWFPRKKRAV